MARQRNFTETLNLRVDPALAAEVKRIAHQRETSESDAARLLLGMGVEAHRAMEAARLRRSYDFEPPANKVEEMVIDVRWEYWEPDDYAEAKGLVP